jgi:hypothetical protein
MGDFTKPRRYIGVFPDGTIAIFSDWYLGHYRAYNPEVWQITGYSWDIRTRKEFREEFGVKFIDKYEGEL